MKTWQWKVETKYSRKKISILTSTHFLLILLLKKLNFEFSGFPWFFFSLSFFFRKPWREEGMKSGMRGTGIPLFKSDPKNNNFSNNCNSCSDKLCYYAGIVLKVSWKLHWKADAKIKFEKKKIMIKIIILGKGLQHNFVWLMTRNNFIQSLDFFCRRGSRQDGRFVAKKEKFFLIFIFLFSLFPIFNKPDEYCLYWITERITKVKR